MNLPLLVPTTLVLVGWFAPEVSAQKVLHANDGDGYYKEHGHTLAAAGDVNGDGVNDYWMGAPDLFDSWPFGSVYLVSGADGSTLLQLDGTDLRERFGYALAGGRDLSGDGVPDVIVGVPRSRGFRTGAGALRPTPGTKRGAVRVFSGADGRLLRQIPGRAALDRFGEAVALLDDVNGDGVADFAVGAPGDDRSATDGGSVRIYSGANGVLLATLFGSGASEEFGAVLVNAGDIDQDGKDELFVGIPRGELGVPDSGKAVLLSGADGAVLRTFAGDATGDDFGRSLAGAGDLDGDGAPDLLVGAPGGRYARAFSGATGAVLWSATRTHPEQGIYHYTMMPENPGSARFGWALCGLGDQDHDGHRDVAVGYPESSSLWILSGTSGDTLGLHTSAALGWNGDSKMAYLGFALAPLGDVNGDGLEDLAVGAPTFSFYTGHSYNDFTGRALVLAGGFRKDHVVGGASESLGRAVSGAGDVDRDGHDDLAFSSFTSGIPRVVVTSGRNRAELRSWSGAPDSGFGRSLARAGDVDADGVEDLLVGAHFEAGSGCVRVFSGATGALLHQFVGDPGDFMGVSVAGIGDCNGDGHADVAVGAPRTYADPVVTGFCTYLVPPLPGYVRVYSGADGSPLFQISGRTHRTQWCQYGVHNGEVFGFSLTGVGDWDRDGVPDLAVGAPGAGSGWSGAVRVFSGVDGMLLREFLGLGGQSEFGVSLAGAPDFDFDADGFVDLVVGEEEIYYGGAVGGGAHVFSSKSGLRLFSHGIQAPAAYGGPIGPGYAVAMAGDFNCDGHSDIALGNPTATSLLGPGAGEVLVLSGADGSVLRAVSGTSSWDYLGYSVAAAGDVDGDGAPDLVAGSPTGLYIPTLVGAAGPNAVPRIRVLGPKRPLESSKSPGSGASTGPLVEIEYD
ncbi:MAG: hypothetical protein HOP15_01020 [Planctomycetes bacterium]|nr:hypothetical protein [Planctomycetota bacterium]